MRQNLLNSLYFAQRGVSINSIFAFSPNFLFIPLDFLHQYLQLLFGFFINENLCLIEVP
jgi:hypothetical protein